MYFVVKTGPTFPPPGNLVGDHACFRDPGGLGHSPLPVSPTFKRGVCMRRSDCAGRGFFAQPGTRIHAILIRYLKPLISFACNAVCLAPASLTNLLVVPETEVLLEPPRCLRGVIVVVPGQPRELGAPPRSGPKRPSANVHFYPRIRIPAIYLHP